MPRIWSGSSGGAAGGAAALSDPVVVNGNANYVIQPEDRWVLVYNAGAGTVYLPLGSEVENGYEVTVADVHGEDGSASAGAPLFVRLQDAGTPLNNDFDDYAMTTPLGSVTFLFDEERGWTTIERPAMSPQQIYETATFAAQQVVAASPPSLGRHEVVIPIRYFDSVGFGDDYNTASADLLFDGPLSENIANPFAGSDIIVTASVFIPNFRIFTEDVDQYSQVGRSTDLGITVGAVSKNHRSWPIYHQVNTPDRLPFMPNPLNSNPVNGMGGYTVSNAVEVEDSAGMVVVSMQDYLNTQPGLTWTLFGHRVPEYMEGIDHARLHIAIQEKPAA